MFTIFFLTKDGKKRRRIEMRLRYKAAWCVMAALGVVIGGLFLAQFLWEGAAEEPMKEIPKIVMPEMPEICHSYDQFPCGQVGEVRIVLTGHMTESVRNEICEKALDLGFPDGKGVLSMTWNYSGDDPEELLAYLAGYDPDTNLCYQYHIGGSTPGYPYEGDVWEEIQEKLCSGERRQCVPVLDREYLPDDYVPPDDTAI